MSARVSTRELDNHPLHRTLAALNHPHIAQIYGLEDLPAVDGAPATFALAMELVEGEDLAQRISRGPVALGEVWPLARQIAYDKELKTLVDPDKAIAQSE